MLSSLGTNFQGFVWHDTRTLFFGLDWHMLPPEFYILRNHITVHVIKTSVFVCAWRKNVTVPISSWCWHRNNTKLFLNPGNICHTYYVCMYVSGGCTVVVLLSQLITKVLACASIAQWDQNIKCQCTRQSPFRSKRKTLSHCASLHIMAVSITKTIHLDDKSANKHVIWAMNMKCLSFFVKIGLILLSFQILPRPWFQSVWDALPTSQRFNLPTVRVPMALCGWQ